ncbi:hypothetical protein N9494_02235 [Polaribacter sp.]|nr:hypothetical protein [Polaribacter sp.]
MDISLAMKNQILFDDIDLLQFTQNKLKQWLVSNFVNILCDHKIYIETVSITPLENIDSNLFYTLEASNENKTYLMEFGELKASDVPRLTKGKLERLFIVNMNEDFDYVSLLKKANAMRYNVSVINNTQTLILF